MPTDKQNTHRAPSWPARVGRSLAAFIGTFFAIHAGLSVTYDPWPITVARMVIALICVPIAAVGPSPAAWRRLRKYTGLADLCYVCDEVINYRNGQWSHEDDPDVWGAEAPDHQAEPTPDTVGDAQR
jgi:hypothetical protein